MAAFEIKNDQLTLQFSTLEKLGGLRSGATVKLKDVKSVEKVDDPWNIIAGLRVGTGIPWVIVLGTMLRRGGNDVVAIYKKQPAVVITFQPDVPYQRFIVTVPPEQVIATIQATLQNRN